MNIELKIRELLQKKIKPELVVDELLNFSVSPKIKTNSLLGIMEYLVLSGHYSDVFRQFPRRFFEKDRISWFHFFELLQIHKIDLEPNLISACQEGAKELHQEEFLYKHPYFLKSEQLKILREKLWTDKENEFLKKKTLLLQKIDFLKSNRMIEEEYAVFEKYLSSFSLDKETSALYKNFKERWADFILSKKNEKRAKCTNINLPQTSESQASSLEKDYMSFLFQYTSQLISEKKVKALDVALLFFFMDWPQYSLVTLETEETSSRQTSHQILEILWFEIFILLDSEDYLFALDKLEKLQTLLPAHSESMFSVTYLRSIAIYQLGKPHKAIEIMEQILALKPNFRAAQTLLSQWNLEVN